MCVKHRVRFGGPGKASTTTPKWLIIESFADALSQVIERIYKCESHTT